MAQPGPAARASSPSPHRHRCHRHRPLGTPAPSRRCLIHPISSSFFPFSIFPPFSPICGEGGWAGGEWGWGPGHRTPGSLVPLGAVVPASWVPCGVRGGQPHRLDCPVSWLRRGGGTGAWGVPTGKYWGGVGWGGPPMGGGPATAPRWGARARPEQRGCAHARVPGAHACDGVRALGPAAPAPHTPGGGWAAPSPVPRRSAADSARPHRAPPVPPPRPPPG